MGFCHQKRIQTSGSKVVAKPMFDPLFRKILVSIKFVSAILGPEVAAPILWTPGKKCVLSGRKTCVHKIPRFRGGGGGVIWVLGGVGGSADFIFVGAGILLNFSRT